MKNIVLSIIIICLFAKLSYSQETEDKDNKQTNELKKEMRTIEKQKGPGAEIKPGMPVDVSIIGSIAYRFQYVTHDQKFEFTPEKDFTKEKEMQRLRVMLGAKINIGPRIEGVILLCTPGEKENRKTFSVFGEDSYKFGLEGIGIAKGYIKAKLFKKNLLQLTFGKFKNPFLSAHLVMAGEVNPTGMFQKLNFTFGNINLGLNMGELIYSKSGGEIEYSKWIIVPQIYAKFNFGNTYFIVSPGVYTFLGRDHDTDYAAGGSGPGYYETDFILFSAYVEFGTKFGRFPFIIKAELIYNLGDNGKPDSIHASSPTEDLKGENLALKIMICLGCPKKIYDWQIILGFIMSQTYALDPDLAMPFMMMWQTSESGFKWNSSSLPWGLIAKAKFMIYHHTMICVDFMYRKRENKGWHLKKGNVFSQTGYVIKTTLEIKF